MVTSSLLGLALALQSQLGAVPIEGNEAFKDLAATWTEKMPAYGVPGFAVVAIKDGKVVLLDAVGVTDPFSNRKANIDTRYYIASITKTMTAAAILKLTEQGKIDLDAPAQKYIPRFTLADAEFAKTVTIRDLLSHRPGIQGDDVVTLDAYTGGITDDRYYRMLGASMPTKKVAYTNVHFTLLGRVIEAVAKRKWQDVLAQEIFAPLGMNRTTAYASATYSDPNFAPPLMPGVAGPVPAPIWKTDRTMHAAGGILSTPRDMARWMQVNLQGGTLDGVRLLQEATVRDGFKNQSQLPISGSIRKLSGYGYAWNVGEYRDSGRFAGHGGGYIGYMAYVALLPDKKSGVAVFVNVGGIGGAFGTLVLIDALDRILGYPIDEELRKNYGEAAAQFRQRLAEAKPLAPNPALSGLLSLPVPNYVGRYHNDLYGDIRVRFTGGMLHLDWDDLPQILKSTGMDAFTAHTDASDATSGRFIVQGKQVVALEAEVTPNRKIRFKRV